MKITTLAAKNKYNEILSIRDEAFNEFRKYINSVALLCEEIEDLMEYDVENCELCENDEIANCEQFWKGHGRIVSSISDCLYALDEDLETEELSNKEITIEDLNALQEIVKRYISLFEMTQKGLNKKHKQIINLKNMIVDATGESEEELEEISGWNEDENENCAVEILKILKKSEANTSEMNVFMERDESMVRLRDVVAQLQREIDFKNNKR